MGGLLRPSAVLREEKLPLLDQDCLQGSQFYFLFLRFKIVDLFIVRDRGREGESKGEKRPGRETVVGHLSRAH